MDSLEKTFLRIQRSANLPAWFVLAIALVYIIPNWIREPPPLTALAIANLSLFFLPSAGLFALGRWSVRGLRRTVEPIRPVIREMGFGPFLTVSIVLQNGLLLQSIRSISFITMFFSTGGRPICPTVADAMRWTRPFRSRREKLLRGSRRKSLAEQRVAQVGEACGGSMAYAVLRHYSGRAIEPNPPAWIAMFAVGHKALTRQSFAWQAVDRIIATSDQILELLESLVPTEPN